MKLLGREWWAQLMTIAGSVAMLVGALDPMEGLAAILPGSALVAAGTMLGGCERKCVVYRLVSLGLVAVGVAALWWLSAAGGIGAGSGRSMWWGVMVLPYLIGWTMGIWGPGSPRWVLVVGMVVGGWFLALMALVNLHSRGGHAEVGRMVTAVMVSLGLVTIGGCAWRLRRMRIG